MIIVTGAAGFIGSCMVGKLNSEGYYDVVVVDDFSHPDKDANLAGKKFTHKIDREQFISWLEENQRLVQFVFHIGARTDTAEFDKELLNRLNLDYTKAVWDVCVRHGIPLVYASSAATYGDGALGYRDDHALSEQLQPLNPYGISKNEFDKWALAQERKPYFWTGFKFFNVYGPNEYHKGRMASVIMHAHEQIKEKGDMALFRSHRPEYKDGEQLRDFVYVKDVVEVLFYFMLNRKHSGIYNLGTGKARSFHALASATFMAMGAKENIRFIDIPADIRERYQYFTEATMDKLRAAGYEKPFHTLEEGISDYVKQYLAGNKYY